MVQFWEKEGIDDFNLLSGKNDDTTLNGLLATNKLIFLDDGNGLSESLVAFHQCKIISGPFLNVLFCAMYNKDKNIENKTHFFIRIVFSG